MAVVIFLFGVVVTLFVSAACALIVEGIRIDKRGREQDEAELSAERAPAPPPVRSEA